MMRRWISGVMLACAITATMPVMSVQAKDLPDFTG